MNVTNALALALPLVHGSEGCALKAYLDTLAKPPVWTIGHGTTRIGDKPVAWGMTCTQAEANAWAEDDMMAAAEQVRHVVRVPLDDFQFAALISFVYNIGIGHFERSGVLESLNLGYYQRAADRLLEYVQAGGKPLAGLTQRRLRERALFTTGAATARVTVAVTSGPTADELNQREIDKFTPPDAA
jgi:lysozyme